MKRDRIYIVIDLKSFYASVECVERGLDPMVTNLVVADPERTDRTICLAITPAMKALGIKNRCRVFEIPPDVPYIMAVPRMALYMEYSARIYEVYKKYAAPEDIHVYSVDEAFIDVTDYLEAVKLNVREYAERIMQDIFETTGILSTCGIGTNMYLAKVALDIVAKHTPDRIGFLTEELYQLTMWDHVPLTDFWMIGPGTARRLAKIGIFTMRQIACADRELIFRLFGINGELLIDHAWGRETAGMQDIKNYEPKSRSLSSGQVLGVPRDYKGGKIIAMEMAEVLSLDLVRKHVVTDSLCLWIHYSCLIGEGRNTSHMAGGLAGNRADIRYRGAVGETVSTGYQTSSSERLMKCAKQAYEHMVHPDWMIHRVNISFNNISPETGVQLSLFSNLESDDRERKLQRAVLKIHDRYGRNSIFMGMDLQEGARTLERNREIGGHRA